jgi:hypothetical protein
MGQGPRPNRKDPPKLPAQKGAGAEAGGSADTPTPSCEREWTLQTRLRPGVAATEGAAVRLHLAAPPRVETEEGEIGELEDRSARYMEACLVEGYRMVGRILEVSRSNGIAQIVVAGVKEAV